METPPIGMTYKSDRFQPKFRRNRKLESKWGVQYHEAVNKAVFANQYTAYMPSEPPQSIKEDIDKTGYVCKQCRDCFRFLSSIEDHTARRSWILGYWCQQCFVTTCIHKPKGRDMCSGCLDIEATKKDYLHSKGIRKTLKKGVTRVFYNQCQFFAHLRSHGITTVDSSEVMLMPLPIGMQREHYAQLDRVFKALMEVMFIRGIHIMDWVRDKKILWNTMLSSNPQKSNPVFEIVNLYADNCLPANRHDIYRQDNPIQFEDSRRKSDAYRSYASQFRRALSESCTSNDIAFVDCGPTPSNRVESPGTSSPNDKDDTLLPELPSAITAKDESQVRVSRVKSLWRSLQQKYDDNKREKSRDGGDRSGDDRAEFSSSTSINPAGPRVLTIRSPKSLSLSTIIKHLPSDGMSRKKVVVVEGESNSLLASTDAPASKKDSSSPATSNSKDNVASTLRETPKDEKPKVPHDSLSLVATSDNSKPSTASANLLTQTFSEQMTLHGRIVFQNGRKYIIRHMPKSKYRTILPGTNFRRPAPLRTLVPATTKSSGAVTKTNPTSKPIPILPKTLNQYAKPVKMASNMSNLSSNVVKLPANTVKLLSKIPSLTGISVTVPKSNASNDIVLEEFPSRMTNHQKSLMAKFRESMLKELSRASRRELETYVEHIKGISDEYSKTMGFDSDSVLLTNAKAIECFEKLASKTTNTEKSRQTNPDAFEKLTKEWELRIKPSDKQRNCENCGKRVKPSTYIVGMSGPAVDETMFCRCYNNVCYLCNANQGSLMQLKTHIKWHKGEKPFMCPDCSIVFPSSLELEIHVWTTCFHPMSRCMYGCGVCEIEGIMDMESIAKHFLLIHTQKKIICSECKMVYTGETPSYTDVTKHFVKHHPDIESISEPKRLCVCSLKQCIVRPELFRTHLSDHIGVLKWIYYKCPFCPMITQGTVRNKAMIREHLIDNHLEQIHEIVSPESLTRIIEGIKHSSINNSLLQNSASGNDEICPPVSNADTSGPMIINARTITPASFEHGSESSEEHQDYDYSTLPKILEVRSEAVEEFADEATIAANDFTLQIIAVESIADNPLESPAIESETPDALSPYDDLTPLSDDTCESVALEICSLPIKGDCESSDFDDTKPAADLPVFETADDPILDKSDITDKYQITRIESPFTRKRLLQKPWRIALNSPNSAEATPVAYNCHLCGELINTSWSVIKNHFDSRHSRDYRVSVVSPQVPRITTDYIDGGYRDDANAPKRKNEVSQMNIAQKRRRRWGPKKYFERPGSPSLGICVRPEPVREVEGSFRCKKCDEPFKDRAILRDHIASNHRIKSQYLICLECGENFVVVPSLQMHLKALHGIQDPITYLSQNTAYAPDILDDADELEKATESNQCYVCMAVFEDKAAVDKHIRVHGMAFLKRKKIEAQKALKSSEKKGEPPDNRESMNGVNSGDNSCNTINRQVTTINNASDTPETTVAS